MKGEEIRVHGLDLNFQEHQQLPTHCKIKKRNFLTIQSALVRGDTEVTLYNPDPYERIRWEDYKRSDADINQVDASGFQIWKDRGKKSKPHCEALGQEAQRNIQNQQWYGLRFKFVKVLARGGHGYVSLWDVMFDDNSIKRVVIKKGLSRAFNPQHESQFHLRYQGAEHTTQVIDLNHEVRVVHEKMRESGSLYFSNITDGNIWDATQQQCVVFEYAPWGDMVDMLTNVAMRKVDFTDQVLWGIWECFVLGLAAIAYQPLIEEGSVDSMWEDAKAKNDTDRFLDWIEKNWEIQHDVHLDLEVFNILAGHNDQSHPYQPVFKIHDLGAWSFKMSDAWPNMPEAGYWSMRGPVKMHGLTPEQFTKDWDSLGISEKDEIVRENFSGDDLTKGNPVAGRYGIWTNTFLIARVMESTITGIYSRFPVQCAPHHTEHGKSAAKTYGWMLQTPQYAHIDPDLRDIVSQCLYERPQDRPSVIDLLRNIAARRAKGFREPPEAVGDWWYRFLVPSEERPLPEPPRPNVGPSQQAVTDQLNPTLNSNGGSFQIALQQIGEAVEQWYGGGRAGAGAGPANQGPSEVTTRQGEKTPVAKKENSDASSEASPSKQPGGGGINPQPGTVQQSAFRGMELDANSGVSPLTLVAQAAQEALLAEQATEITHGLLPEQTGQDTNPHSSATRQRIAKEIAPNPTSSLSSGTKMAQETSGGVHASKENTIPRTSTQNIRAGLLETHEMFQHDSDDEESNQDIYEYSGDIDRDSVLPPFARRRVQQAVPAESNSPPAFLGAVTGHGGEVQPESGPEVEPETNSPELPPSWVFENSSENTAQPRTAIWLPLEMDTRNDNPIPIQPANTGFQIQRPPPGLAPVPGLGWLQPQQEHEQQRGRPTVCSPLAVPTHGNRDAMDQDSPDTPSFGNGTLNGGNARVARIVGLVASPTSPTSPRSTTSSKAVTSPKSVKSNKVSKRVQKTKKARRKESPQSSKDIMEYVQKWLPDMPVAIRNLVTRSKHLEAQIKGGHLPVYAYMD